MKYDADFNGYFEKGVFIPQVQNSHDVQPSSTLGVTYTFEHIQEIVDRAMAFNLPIMPSILQLGDIGNYNLYSIYKQAYISIACGLYDAGLILLGQLLEMTLKQIILVKTGKSLKKETFGSALTIERKECVLEYEDVVFLRFFINKVRNPYTHRDFRVILGNRHLPIWRVPVIAPGEKFNAQRMVAIVAKAIEGIKSGESQPEFIDPASDPGIACSTKEHLDHLRAIFLIWLVTLKFEQLVGIYLNQKCYDKHLREHGSPFDKIATRNV